MKKFFFFFSLLLIASPFLASAYYESAGNGKIKASVSPEHPAPEEKVSIRLSSFSSPLDTCNIIWRQDRKAVKEGIGGKSYSFQTLPLGQSTEISVLIECPAKDTVQKDFIFQSNDVDLLITADTYTPPLYRGNSLAVPGSRVKIVAMPQVFDSTDSPIPPEQLVYRWEKDGKSMPLSSGYGKNTVQFFGSDLKGVNSVSVEVSSVSGDIKAVKNLTLPLSSPQIHLYENRPLSGIQYQLSFPDYLTLNKEEMTIVAEPYYFPNSDLASNKVAYSWFMNSKSITPSGDNRTLTVRQGKDTSGEASIALRVTPGSSFASAINKLIRLNFARKGSAF